jgi:hypothetical protein
MLPSTHTIQVAAVLGIQERLHNTQKSQLGFEFSLLTESSAQFAILSKLLPHP